MANYSRFLSFLERRVESREIAEDILQEAFVRGVGGADSVRRDESVIAWFYRVLRHAVTDHYRRRDARHRALDRVAVESAAHQDPIDTELMDEACACVLGLLSTLKSAYADILRRVDMEGISVGAYARAHDLTPNNAAVRLHRARTRLRDRVVEACRTCTEHACLDCTCKDAVPTC